MIPVFVPSYKRPKAIFLRRAFLYDFPLYVFVRKEDSGYEYLRERPNTYLVKLKHVNDIGETRAAMLRYADKKGIEKVFMLDDDISRLDLTVFDEEKGVARASGTVMGQPEDWRKVLNRWEKSWKDEALLGASYRPFSWSMKQEQITRKIRAQLQQCVGVNVALLMRNGLNYRSNSEVGNEDLFLQYECYKKGLPALKTNSVQYDCPAMGSGTGGCNSDGVSIEEKQTRRVSLFLDACKNDPMIRVSTTRSGVPSIKFNWKEIE